MKNFCFVKMKFFMHVFYIWFTKFKSQVVEKFDPPGPLTARTKSSDSLRLCRVPGQSPGEAKDFASIHVVEKRTPPLDYIICRAVRMYRRSRELGHPRCRYPCSGEADICFADRRSGALQSGKIIFALFY
jgi:hypothetical protein